MERLLEPAIKVRGEISLPGDKSIWHRALIIGAISEGKTEIVGEPAGDDVLSTESCLKQLGIKISRENGKTVVSGNGPKGLKKPESVLDAGNSGTTVRLLSGVLSAQNFESVIDGDSSLRKRPMNRIIAPLSMMGAQLLPSDSGGCPLNIIGTADLNSISYKVPVASAQVKSALLLASVCGGVELELSEPYPTRNHTELMLRQCGVKVKTNGNSIHLDRNVKLNNSVFGVPGDFSSAAFFITAALMLPESEIILKDVGLNPTRTGFLNVIKKMGADFTVNRAENRSGESYGEIIIRHSDLKAVTITAKDIPSIIDELPLIGILGTVADGITRVSGASELRVKESDRISLLVEGLRGIGVTINEFEDGFSIEGGQKILGGIVDSANDHRIAMSFAVAGLASKNGVTVKDSQSASVSYPSFFADLEKLSE